MKYRPLVFDPYAPALYLDFDGTLHGGPALIDEAGHAFLESGGALLEHATLLVNLLAPHSNVQIILSTSWLKSMPSERVIEYLPCGLRHRVVGDTNRVVPRFGEVRNGTARTNVILRHARAAGLTTWLALDDAAFGIPREFERHFVRLESARGISCPDALQQIRDWLSQSAGLCAGEPHAIRDSKRTDG
jgi:hypothetical protein